MYVYLIALEEDRYQTFHGFPGLTVSGERPGESGAYSTVSLILELATRLVLVLVLLLAVLVWPAAAYLYFAVLTHMSSDRPCSLGVLCPSLP